MEGAEELELVVIESRIEIGGVARLHISALEQIGARSGDHVVVSFGKKSILVRAFGDRMMAEGEISLRARDRKKLEVGEGSYVTISPHVSLGEALRNRFSSLRKGG